MVAVPVGKGDGQRLAFRALGHQGTERLTGVLGPVNGIGQVDHQRFLLAHQQVDVRAVVEMGQVPVGIELLARGIGTVIILDVIDVLADDGHGVGTDFDVFCGTAGGQREGQRKSRQEGGLLHLLL